MATTEQKRLAENIVTDWIVEERERAGQPFVLDPGAIADGYGLDEDAVEAVCERLAVEPGAPLTETNDGWVVET